MEWDKPSPTITGQCYGFGNGRFGHPTQDRALSLREAALLQTFPEDYRFVRDDGKFPGMTNIGRLIGNAVPPLLGRVIGQSILKHLQGLN
jgi:DNA (cytosine-5)-methyltransferase 1